MEKNYKNLLVAGAGDFMAPYLHAALSAAAPGDASVWMLGAAGGETRSVDFIAGVPELPCAMDAVVYCDASDSSVKGYNRETAAKAARNLTAALEQHLPQALVYLSCVDVYGKASGEGFDESTLCEPVTEYGNAKLEAESILTGWCDTHGVTLSILRPAMIVGTGMGGELRRLVNRIYRATYRHIAENEARVSVVHAVTVASAAAALLGRAGVWNVTDGVDPTRHDLAEAFAWRLDNKRIYTLPASKARLLARIGDYLPVTGFTTKSLEHELSTLTFDGSRLVAETGVEPVSVTYYLRNHNYDESSL